MKEGVTLNFYDILSDLPLQSSMSLNPMYNLVSLIDSCFSSCRFMLYCRLIQDRGLQGVVGNRICHSVHGYVRLKFRGQSLYDKISTLLIGTVSVILSDPPSKYLQQYPYP